MMICSQIGNLLSPWIIRNGAMAIQVWENCCWLRDMVCDGIDASGDGDGDGAEGKGERERVSAGVQLNNGCSPSSLAGEQ